MFACFSSDIEPPTPPVSPTVGNVVQQPIPTQYIIIGGTAGGIVLLVLIIVVIIAITAVYTRRKRSMRSEYKHTCKKSNIIQDYTTYMYFKDLCVKYLLS